jgi:hypothetical protein
MDWINLAYSRDLWGALVSKVMNHRFPQNAKKSMSSCTTGGLSRTQLLGVDSLFQF